MSIVQGISQLEGVDSISTSLLNLVIDLPGCLSVLVHSISELDFADKPHRLATDQVVALSKNSFHFGMLGRQCSKYTGRDLFFAVFKEYWVLDDCVDIAAGKSRTCESKNVQREISQES